MLLSADAREHIAAALAHSGDMHSVDSVLEMVEEGSAVLHQRPHSTFVTQEFELPKARQLHFWLAGGDLDDLIEAEKEIVDDARYRGITKVTIIGRPGWQKKLEGFRQAGVILVKDI